MPSAKQGSQHSSVWAAGQVFLNEVITENKMTVHLYNVEMQEFFTFPISNAAVRLASLEMGF